MAFTTPEEEAWRAKRKRKGKLLGIFGLALLFGPALAIRFVPSGWEVSMIVLMALATGVLVYSYLLVR